MCCVKQQKKALEAKDKELRKQIGEVQAQLAHLDDVEEGDKPDAGQASRIKSQKFSFTVHFERSKSLKKVRSPGAVCVSERRFTTSKEAAHHAKRFAKQHKHKDFTVVMVNKRANAWINWTTGKTNPVTG